MVWFGADSWLTAIIFGIPEYVCASLRSEFIGQAPLLIGASDDRISRIAANAESEDVTVGMDTTQEGPTLPICPLRTARERLPLRWCFLQLSPSVLPLNLLLIVFQSPKYILNLLILSSSPGSIPSHFLSSKGTRISQDSAGYLQLIATKLPSS